MNILPQHLIFSHVTSFIDTDAGGPLVSIALDAISYCTGKKCDVTTRQMDEK